MIGLSKYYLKSIRTENDKFKKYFGTLVIAILMMVLGFIGFVCGQEFNAYINK
jgi:hypothetical protein